MKIGQTLNAGSWMGTTVAVVTLVMTGSAFAESQDEHREHGAHVHGHGTLDIVVEGEELVAELRIPAANVVGFEHAPRDDAEREAVRHALVPFSDAASVLVPSPEAQCEVEKSEARITSMTGEEHHDEDEHHRQEGHGHEGEHEDEHGSEIAGHDHEEHEHEHEGDAHASQAADSDAEAHSELHAEYHFHCHSPERLARIEFRAFEHLHDAEEIEVRIVTPSVQTAIELHPGDTVIELGH